MNFFKKTSAIILVFSLILSCVPNVGLASNEFNIGTYVIADFTTEEDCNKIKSDNVSYSAGSGYENGAALLWNVDGYIDYPVDPEVDFTGYDEVHIRYKSALRYQRFNIGFSGTEEYDDNSYEYVSVMTLGSWQEFTLNISDISDAVASSSNQNGISFIRFDASASSAMKGTMLYIDKIWLVSNEIGTEMKVESCSVADGEMYLSPDLDGENSISFEFDKPLYDCDYSDALEIYEVVDTGKNIVDVSVLASVNDNVLTIIFDKALKVGSEYEVVLKSGMIYSKKGAQLKSDYSLRFGIGIGNLEIESVSIESGVQNVDAHLPGYEITYGFNSEISEAFLTDEYIYVLENGKKYSEDYEISAFQNKLTIRFLKALSDYSDYEVIISKDVEDIMGGKLTEDYCVSFKTCPENFYIADDGVVFDADNNSDAEFAVKNGADIVDSDANCIEKSAKYYGKTNSVNTYTVFEGMSDISAYGYLNCFVYIPDTMNDEVAIAVKSNSAQMTHTLSYTPGWNTIFLKLSDFDGYSDDIKNAVSQISITIGSNGICNEECSIQLGKMWLATTEPVCDFEVVKSECGIEESNVSADLGGDNTFTIEFSDNVLHADDVVIVEKYSDMAFRNYSDYRVKLSGKNIDIIFNNKLSKDDLFRISVVPESVYSKNLIANKNAFESTFCIEAPIPLFKVESVSLDNQTYYDPDAVSEFVIVFNDNVNAELNHEAYIQLYENDVKTYGLFEAVVNGKTAVLKFSAPLKADSEYKVVIDSKYCSDRYFALMEETGFVFHTSGKAVSSICDVFSADNDAMTERAKKSGGTLNYDNQNIYDRNIAFPIVAGRSQTFQVQSGTIDVSGMNYLNFYIYVPEDGAGNVVNIPIYYSGSKYYLTTATLKAGWNLVTKSLKSITAADIWGHIEKTNLEFGGWSKPWSASTTVLIEKIWYSQSMPVAPKLLSTSMPDGYTNASSKGEKISFVFDENLYEASPVQISVKDSSGNIINDYSYEIKDNVLSVLFNTLNINTDYALTISGLFTGHYGSMNEKLNFSFKTSAGKVSVYDNIDISRTGDVYTAKYSISNTSAESAKLGLNMLFYDENGILIKSSSETSDIPAAESVVKEVSFECANASSVKAFVSDELSDIVSGKFSQLKASVLTSNVPFTVSGDGNVEIKANSGVVALVLKAQSGPDTGVVSIVSPDGTKLVCEPVSFEGKNDLILHYDISSKLTTGIYKATLMMNGKIFTSEIHMLSEAEKSDVLNISNSKNSSDIQNMLRKYGYVDKNASSVLVSDYSDRIIKFAPYYDSDVAYSKILEIVSILGEINSVHWEDMASYITENHDIIFDLEHLDSLKDFEAFVSRDKKEVARELSKKRPFTSVSDFLDEFENIVENQKPGEESLSKPGKGGSGGGGGGKTPVSYPLSDNTPSVPEMPETSGAFTDLSEYSWAQESIESLYKMNIISNPADGMYRPADNVTREEFVKLIVCAFFPDAKSEAHLFGDTKPNEWYVPYISAAYSLGIVTGKDDGTFGIGEYVTRQDMAVIAGRALEAYGKNVKSSNDLSFSDKSEISDYAYAYVGGLSQSGVINGMGDGSFAPLQNANRAQAAVIINRMLNTHK